MWCLHRHRGDLQGDDEANIKRAVIARNKGPSKGRAENLSREEGVESCSVVSK